MTLSYRDALVYLYGLTDYEKKGFAAYAPQFYDLERVRTLLSHLDNPQERLRIVHIAGTKGKGSTAAICESILRAAGRRSALFTSPHLHTFRERMQVCGTLIEESEVVRLVRRLRPLVKRVPGVTTFEVLTAMALEWFAEQEAEWAVLEVGLGGRLDATNVVQPSVAVITSISLDHTAILGDTVAKIAGEKAGIIKAGVPTVSAPQVAEALTVLEAVCRHQASPLTLVGRDWTWRAEGADLDGQRLSLACGARELRDLWTPLLGEHQLVNAATAVAALSQLPPAGFALGEEAVRQGLRAVYWPGRLEILGRAPLVVADSAHNPDSAEKLVTALDSLCQCRSRTLVLGASADHVTDDLLHALVGSSDRAIATRSRHPRAADPAWIQDRARALGLEMLVAQGVPASLDLALAGAAPDDLICCTGSVFVAAEARAAWFARQGLPLPPSDPE